MNMRLLDGRSIGDVVQLGVRREGAERSVKITLQAID